MVVTWTLYYSIYIETKASLGKEKLRLILSCLLFLRSAQQL